MISTGTASRSQGRSQSAASDPASSRNIPSAGAIGWGRAAGAAGGGNRPADREADQDRRGRREVRDEPREILDDEPRGQLGRGAEARLGLAAEGPAQRG